MISMLILTIVCIAWLQIIGVQSARKEARRREAVERLAGMMDAFLYVNMTKSSVAIGGYRMDTDGNAFDFTRTTGDDNVLPLFEGDVSPIGYTLSVITKSSLPYQEKFDSNWGTCKWIVGRLYDHSGSMADAGKPFFTLSVCLGL